MERLKKWRREIILLMVIGVFIATRILLFESVWMNDHMDYYPNYEKYQTYMLLELKFTTKHGFMKKYTRYDEYIFMFQWQYNRLVKEIRAEICSELDEIVEKYQSITDYAINEGGKIIDIYYCEEVNGTILSEVEGDIESLVRMLSIFIGNEGKYYVYWRDATQVEKK